MNEAYTKWVACWGNATSITEQVEAMYARHLTLRYPIRMCFSGCALRLRFSNLTGTEPVTLTRVQVARSVSGNQIDGSTIAAVTFGGHTSLTLAPGQEQDSDAIPFSVTAGETLAVSIYLADYTQMNAGVLITGPLSGGYYSYGNNLEAETLPLDLTRKTNWYYFLNTVDILTEPSNHALICYGDSITAQSWPDDLILRAWDSGHRNISVIRRAVSGTRILRQYNCITYAAYGLKGAVRFPIEVNTAGADTLLIQHGINDIIHPVGTDVNPFRPWEDLPTVEDLIRGTEQLYVEPARAIGLKVWNGTLLPIQGWRTDAPFREELRCRFNDWLRTSPVFDGCVDFDAAIRDPENPAAFAPGCDSGDHLHPSEEGYLRMANAIPEALLI